MQNETIDVLPLRFEGVEESPYAGFWRRFGALWLDFLIMLPWTVVSTMYSNAGRLNMIYSWIPGYIIFFLYYVYAVQRWGGTPGKLIAGVIIVRKDGKKRVGKKLSCVMRYSYC